MPRREELERVWAWVLEAGSPARQVVRAQRALQDLAAETEASVRRQWEVRAYLVRSMRHYVRNMRHQTVSPCPTYH